MNREEFRTKLKIEHDTLFYVWDRYLIYGSHESMLVSKRIKQYEIAIQSLDNGGAIDQIIMLLDEDEN